MNAPVRVVRPAPWQRAAQKDAPFAVFFEGASQLLQLATAAAGLGVAVDGEAARVVGSEAQLRRLQEELSSRDAALAQALADALDPEPAWDLRTRALSMDGPHIMGILNLTEDSFSGDGVGHALGAAMRRAEALRAEGADLIDVGAETARADRPVMDADQEAALSGQVVAALVREGHLVSADTYKPEVARAALAAGAEVINDISGLTLGTGAAQAAAQAGAGYVLNYSYSIPKRRPDRPPVYSDVVAETLGWMAERVAMLCGLGIQRGRIAIDPGIAFGKSHDEDLQVLRRAGEFTSLGVPLLLAHSRKNFIGSINGSQPAERDPETHAATVLAYAQGARIFRVHDAAGTRRALDVARAVLGGAPGDYAPDGSSWPWRAGAAGSHMTTASPDSQAPAGQRW
ncbi:MAG: dihydropteroate synthase [Tepidiformaceae bacterium]